MKINVRIIFSINSCRKSTAKTETNAHTVCTGEQKYNQRIIFNTIHYESYD